MGQTRRAFTREFKQEAVKLVTAGGHPTAQFARDLGITPNLLRRWKHEVAGDPVAAFPGQGRRKPHMAIDHRRPARSVVHHPARGSPYAAPRYRELLVGHGLTASMSRRGNCWDNAVVERRFHTLNTAHVQQPRSRTREEARQDIFEWIAVFDTRVRRHSTLGDRSPAEFEAMATGS
jgi:hypothetical protein